MKKKTGCLLVLLIGFVALVVAVVIAIRADLRYFESNRDAILSDLRVHFESNDWDYVVTEGEKYTLSEDKELVELVNLAKRQKQRAEESEKVRFIGNDISQTSSRTTSKPTPESSKLLPGIQVFLKSHKEYGIPEKTRDIPSWHEGRRQSVQFSDGRNLLFYLKDEVVVTVYEEFSGGKREKIWNSYSGTSEYMKDISRDHTEELPEYTVISATKLLAGGNQADVLIPSLSRNTPYETRREVAFAIRKNEGLRVLSMFSTREAYKAAYSSSYAKQHPEASEGYLGGISMSTGKFQD